MVTYPALCFPSAVLLFPSVNQTWSASAKCWSERSRWAFKKIVKTLEQKWIGVLPPGMSKIARFRVQQTPKISGFSKKKKKNGEGGAADLIYEDLTVWKPGWSWLLSKCGTCWAVRTQMGAPRVNLRASSLRRALKYPLCPKTGSQALHSRTLLFGEIGYWLWSFS